MQKFATEVFRYLAQRGSKIRTLVVSPDGLDGMERPSFDDDGHRWPRYFYSYGSVWSIRGEHVVAVPVHMTDVEFCDRATR